MKVLREPGYKCVIKSMFKPASCVHASKTVVNVESLSELKAHVCLHNRLELLQCQVLADSCLYWQVIHLSIACRSATLGVV